MKGFTSGRSWESGIRRPGSFENGRGRGESRPLKAFQSWTLLSPRAETPGTCPKCPEERRSRSRRRTTLRLGHSLHVPSRASPAPPLTFSLPGVQTSTLSYILADAPLKSLILGHLALPHLCQKNQFWVLHFMVMTCGKEQEITWKSLQKLRKLGRLAWGKKTKFAGL